MSKPYSIFKAPTGVYYAQIRLPDGTRSTKRSTGCYFRAEAERVAIKWIAEGAVNSDTSEPLARKNRASLTVILSHPF